MNLSLFVCKQTAEQCKQCKKSVDLKHILALPKWGLKCTVSVVKSSVIPKITNETHISFYSIFETSWHKRYKKVVLSTKNGLVHSVANLKVRPI